MDTGKTTWFLKLIVGIVLTVGLLISALSFYILMLSIYLLLQKNTAKMQNLLLIGYTPARVVLPYQMLTVGLNLLVLVLSVGLVMGVRGYYLDVISKMFTQFEGGSLSVMLLVGSLLFVVVSVFNIWIISKKVNRLF